MMYIYIIKNRYRYTQATTYNNVYMYTLLSSSLLLLFVTILCMESYIDWNLWIHVSMVNVSGDGTYNQNTWDFLGHVNSCGGFHKIRIPPSYHPSYHPFLDGVFHGFPLFTLMKTIHFDPHGYGNPVSRIPHLALREARSVPPDLRHALLWIWNDMNVGLGMGNKNRRNMSWVTF